MKKIIYIIFSLSLFFVACSDEGNIIDEGSQGNKIELSFKVDNFIQGALKSTNPGSNDEQTINNLYIFLFPTTGSQVLIKYYISASVFTGGSWSDSDRKVLLNLTQSEAGSREVYIVANCSDIKTNLDAVTTISGLQSALRTTVQPWSASITTPILMSGNKTHNFNSNRQLDNVLLIRTVAKVQLNIKLAAEHQEIPVINSIAQYNYKFIDFDRNTYVLKQSAKPDDLVSFLDWQAWDAVGNVSSYVLNNGKVSTLSITTYLNERDNKGSIIELKIPYLGSGPLPPPEFGDETYKLSLPAKIERNHWYIYDIEI